MQGDVRQMEYALNSVERRFGGFAGTVSRTGRTMSAAGRAMTIGLTAPILAGGGAAVKAAMDYETAFASVNKVLSDADLKNAHITLDQLSDSLRNMAAGAEAIPIEGGVNTLAEIMAKGGALGVPVERLQEFTEVMAKLSLTADDISADQAATSFGHLNTALGFSEGQILATADAIVHLGNNGASTEGQILSMMSAIAGSAAIVGLSHDQTVAWAASMANIGEKAQAGGSSLSRYFQNVSDAVSGLDPDKMQVLVDVLDMSQESIRKMFKDDPNKILTDFMVNLSKLDPSKWTSVLADMGLGDLLRRRGFTKMLNALRDENAGSLVDMLHQVGSAQGQMQIEYEKRAETLASKIQVIGQKLYEAGIRLGESLIPIIKDDLLPIIEDMVKWIQDAADWFAKLPEPVRKTALQVGILVAAAGPLLFILGGILQFAAPLVGIFQKLGGLLGMVIPGLGGITGGGKGMAASMLGVQKVFVVNFPPGFGGPGAGTPPIATGGGFLGSFSRGFAKIAGPAFALIAGYEIGQHIGNALLDSDWYKDLTGVDIPGARNFEQSGFEATLDSNDAARLDKGIQAIKDQLNPDYWDLPAQLAMVLDAGGIRTTLENQLAALEAERATLEDVEGNTRGSVEAANAVRDGWDTAASTIAGKLDKLNNEEVIEHLARTTEMGLKGVGTSIENGIKTGMDPVGDIATQILARAEHPKDPAVMTEIRGHIAGLEEIQKTYLERGDVKLAEKVQANIDTLYKLIDEVDTSNAINELHRQNAIQQAAIALSVAERHITATNANGTQIMLDRQAVQALNLNEGARFASLNGQVYAVKASVDGMHLTLMNKNFSPVIYNNNIVTAGPSGPPIMYNPAGGKEIGAPQHQAGAWNIRNNELAFLHAGEMVVPSGPAETWRQAMASMHSSGPRDGAKEEHYHLEVDGLMRVQRPSELIRPMKHLARGKRLMQPGYDFRHG